MEIFCIFKKKIEAIRGGNHLFASFPTIRTVCARSNGTNETGHLNRPMKALHESWNTCKSENLPHFQFLAERHEDESRSFVKLFPLRGNI